MVRQILRSIIVGLLLISVALSVIILIAGKVKPLGTMILASQERQKGVVNGDLYSLSFLEGFRETITETKLKERFPCADKPIVIMGDSFFNTGFDSDPVPNALEESIGKKICYRATSRQDLTPLQYVAMMGHTNNDRPGIFVWETIERKSLERALALNSADNSDTVPVKKRHSERWEAIHHALFDRVDVEYILKNNRYTRPLNVWLRNKAFAWFGDTNQKTPIATLNPPMLFMDDEVAFHENASKINQIDTAADAIVHQARILKDRHNLTLLYVIIPDKFSIYGDLAGGRAYDQYIPRFLEALEKRNVHTLDLYRIFKEQKQKSPNTLLYYAGDTHYTPVGKKLLIDVLEKVLDTLSGDTDNAKRDT